MWYWWFSICIIHRCIGVWQLATRLDYGTEWSYMCWCAVKKLLTHSPDWTYCSIVTKVSHALGMVSSNERLFRMWDNINYNHVCLTYHEVCSGWQFQAGRRISNLRCDNDSHLMATLSDEAGVTRQSQRSTQRVQVKMNSEKKSCTLYSVGIMLTTGVWPRTAGSSRGMSL